MSRTMKKMLFITGIFFGCIFGYYSVKSLVIGLFMAHYKPPAVTISAANALDQTWQEYLSSVGTLSAINGTELSSESSGIVADIKFTSGQFVKAGDVLVLLNMDVEKAELQNNEAKLKLATINHERNKILLGKHVLAAVNYDQSEAELQEATANRDATLAKIKQKTITAPFSGKIGIKLVNIGDYVAAGTPMVSLQALDPLHVQFTLPEQYLNDLYVGQAITLKINRREQDTHEFAGTINAINAEIDETTRTILVEATVPNKEVMLYPGMYAEVRVWLKAKNHVITLPQTAVSYTLHGDSVYIIQKDPKSSKKHPVLLAERQYVKVGERRDDIVSIVEGVKVGDQVVSSGQLKLQNHTPVEIDNSAEN